MEPVAANGDAQTEEVLFDPRGLVELDETVPNVAEIDGDSAQFDAKDLTTRKINAELRRLVYEEGIKDVTILNPSAGTPSASGSSRAARSPSRARSATSASASSTAPRCRSTGALAGRSPRT